jgi:HD-like signal output (HDOD) protein
MASSFPGEPNVDAALARSHKLSAAAHAHVSGILPRHWGFSAEIEAAVVRHHDSQSHGAGQPLMDVVAVADWLVLSSGDRYDLELAERPERAIGALDLGQGALAMLAGDASRICAALRVAG